MQSKCVVNSLGRSSLAQFQSPFLDFGLTNMIYAYHFTIFRDVILAQELDKEEMISKYSCNYWNIYHIA